MLRVAKDYGKDVSWSVCSLFAHDNFAWKLSDVLKDLKYDNPIKYVFGGIPCLFQGGRIPPRWAEFDDALKIFDMYRERGIGCRLTFSNNFIEPDELDNTFCNSLMKYLNDMGKDANNGVIVTLDILAMYIKDKYPNLQVISSQVKPSVEVGLGDDKDTVDYYNKLFDLYDLVVINPTKVNDGKFLDEIKYPDRVEFIANHRCLPNCPYAKFHYETQDMLGHAILNESPEEEIENYKVTLTKLEEKCYNTKAQYPLAGASLSQTDIESLVRKGFTQFKIEGREIDYIPHLRDLGDYVFNSYLFTRIASAIMGGVI